MRQERHSEAQWNPNVLRLVSLLLAIVIWVTFSGKILKPKVAVGQKYLQVPLAYENIPEFMRLKTENYQIRLTLKGKEDEIRNITPENVLVTLNLEGYQADTFNLPLSRRNVKLPDQYPSIEVDAIVPDVVRLTLVPETVKSLPLYLGTTGEPAAGYEFKDLIINPPRVTVKGPSASIDELTVLIAKPIDLTGMKSSSTGRVQFDFKNQIPPDTVIEQLRDLRYRVIVEEKQMTKIAPQSLSINLPVDLQDKGVTLQPDKAKATVSGPRSLVERVDPEWAFPLLKWEGDSELPRALGLATEWRIPEEMKDQVADLPFNRLTIIWEPDRIMVTPTTQNGN